MTIYGYCRINTKKQNIERQERNIVSVYPTAHIIKETYTSTKIEGRKELDNLLKHIKSQDTFMFDSVYRMSRNANEGCSMYEDLFDKNINLVFLKEPHMNTQVYREALNNQINIKLSCVLLKILILLYHIFQ